MGFINISLLYPSSTAQRLFPTQFLTRNFLQRMSLDGSTFAISVEKVLDSEEAVAASLEDATCLECQRDLGRGRKEPVNLHGITSDPTSKHGHSKAFARLGLRIGDDLRDWKNGFDGEADDSDELGICGIVARCHAGHDNLTSEQAHEEVDDELPIWFRRSPLPKVVRSLGKDTFWRSKRQAGLATLV